MLSLDGAGDTHEPPEVLRVTQRNRQLVHNSQSTARQAAMEDGGVVLAAPDRLRGESPALSERCGTMIEASYPLCLSVNVRP